MSRSSSASPSAEPEAPRYRVFMDAGLFSPFNLKRALYYLLVPLPLLGICLHAGQGVLGLALAAVAFWPFPFRCHVERDGIRITWLVIEERVPWHEIVRVELSEDGRREVVGKRPRFLLIERRDKPRLALRGRPDALLELAALLARRPATRV